MSKIPIHSFHQWCVAVFFLYTLLQCPILLHAQVYRSYLRFKSIRNIVASSSIFLLQLGQLGENTIFPDLSSACYATTTDEQLTTRQKVIRQSNSILSGPIFETIRKMDEVDPDSSISESTKRYFLLVPIVELYESILEASSLLQEGGNKIPLNKLQEVKSILAQGKFDSGALKKTFNRYGDNIYYADPARANVYLAGGALPGTVQTEQYLLRNDIITNVQNIRSDITDFLAGSSSSERDLEDQGRGQEMADMVDDFQETLRAFRSYLDRAGAEDLQAATDIVKSQRRGNPPQ